MPQRILIAYDGSPSSKLALEECAAMNPAGAAIHILAVVQDIALAAAMGEYVPPIAFEQDSQTAENDLKEAVAFLAKHGLAATPHTETGEPIEVIARLVKELDIDLLIIGHKRERHFAMRLLRGSTGAGLIDRVMCPILIAKAESV